MRKNLFLVQYYEKELYPDPVNLNYFVTID